MKLEMKFKCSCGNEEVAFLKTVVTEKTGEEARYIDKEYSLPFSKPFEHFILSEPYPEVNSIFCGKCDTEYLFNGYDKEEEK